MSTVSLKGLTKTYGENTVVDHIDLEIKNGSLVSILGPSGCGKTTTLRMIAGFELPDAGEVLFDDQPVGQVPVNKRNIGMVFQSYALFPHMTVFQNVAYGLEQQKVSKVEIEKRVNDALKMVHMEDYASRKPKQLSGGQQQRVALARALVIRPKVLLLDECLSALDKKLRVEMQIELRKILEESKVTTFFVTHDQEEAMTLSDQIVVMHNGIIEQTGSPMEVYEKPVNKFVADFLGKANFFDGLLEKVEDHVLTLKMADGRILLLPGDCDEVNSEVHFAVRPEKILVSAEKIEGASLEGRIDSLTYSGNITSCVVDCAGIPVKAEMSGSGLAMRLNRGDKVYLTWDAASLVHLEE